MTKRMVGIAGYDVGRKPVTFETDFVTLRIVVRSDIVGHQSSQMNRDDTSDVEGRAEWELALLGDETALTRLVRRLTPVVQARVARKLLLCRDRSGGSRDVRQEVEDLTQEIFLILFADDGRVLAGWDPARGLSLANFVGLVAERQTVSILRSGRRSPWRDDPTLSDELERIASPVETETTAASREVLAQLFDRLTEVLSPLGRQLFDLLLVEETPVAEATLRTGLSADAVYAWRSRLRKLARNLLAELSEPTPRARTPARERNR